MPIKIISDQSEEELRRAETERRRQQALESLKYALRTLTANLMRIARGAGKPLEIMAQMVAVADAMREYHDAGGPPIAAEQIHTMLDCERAWSEHRPWIDKADRAPRNPSEDLRAEAMRQIRDGALQVAASMLVDQLTHVRRGRDGILAGVRMLEEARELRAGDDAVGRRRQRPRKR